MLKSTRKNGLGVLLLLVTIVPLLLATYGIITGHPMFAEQGKGITALIVIGMVSMCSFSAYATMKMNAQEQVAEEIKTVQKATPVKTQTA